MERRLHVSPCFVAPTAEVTMMHLAHSNAWPIDGHGDVPIALNADDRLSCGEVVRTTSFFVSSVRPPMRKNKPEILDTPLKIPHSYA